MLYRSQKKVKPSNKADFHFQVVDWVTNDIYNDEDDENTDDSFEEEENKYKKKDGKYLIKIYGVTESSDSVCLFVKNFTPYFFIKVPDDWKGQEAKKLIYFLKQNVAAKHNESIVNFDLVKRKEFYGFTNNKMFNFLRIEFKSQQSMRSYSRLFDHPIRIPSISPKPIAYKLYESNIDPLLRFVHVQDLKPVGWIEIKKNTFSVNKIKETRCQYEFVCDWKNVLPYDKTDIGPMTVASFDIECTSSDGSFPKADRAGDEIIQIGTTVNRYGEQNCYLKHMITLGKCNPIEGVVVESYDTEKEVLLAWRDLMQRLDPDIITGYNIWGFDLKYMYDRAKFLGIENRFCQLGRLKSKKSELREKQLQSSALGQNFFYILEMEGRVQIDLMKLVQKDYKLDMYKLDFVANHFLKSNKVDLSPKELFNKFREGSPQSIKDIAVYCVQDCELCNRLINKLEAITNNVGMGNVCFVPLSWLFLRGQGVKIYSFVSKRCREEKILIPLVRKAGDEDGGYEGAIVLVATPGIYLEPISVMDYASLYPSSMISENISHDSIVWLKIYDNYGKLIKDWGNKEYMGLPDYEYNIIEFDNFEGVADKKEKVGRTVCCFAEHISGKKNVIPRILETLLYERRRTRKSAFYKLVKLKNGKTDEGNVSEKDGKVYVNKYEEKPVIYDKKEVISYDDKYNEFQKAVLDGLQLAYKITANSLYGQIGARTSQIYFKELAACTTATGRKLLRFAKDHTEKSYPGSVCVYGDSVTGDTPLLLKDNNDNIVIKTIESLGEEWIPYEEFKKEQSNRREKQQSSCEYKIWVKDHWANINRVIRHKTLKKLYRVNTHQGSIDVTEDHSLVDMKGNKIKCDDCKINETLLLHGFPEEYNEKPLISIEDSIQLGNLLKNKKSINMNELNKIINSNKTVKQKFIDNCSEKGLIKVENKLIAQHIYYILSSLGLKIRVNTENNIYCLEETKNELTNVVKKILPLGYNDENKFVYDIETSSGKFNGGVGKICVSNTDSVFVNFTKYWENKLGLKLKGKEALKKSIELGIVAGEEVTRHLKKPHDLEYEKTFYPFVQLAKKRYVGNLYGTSVDKFYQNSMGIVLKRRDNANIVKHIYGGIIDIIMNKQDIQEAMQFFIKEIHNLLEGNVDLKQLVITKTLRADYKNPESIAHKVLAERMGERDPGNKPQSNDRVPFIYIKTNAKKGQKVLQGDKVEHPEYIKQNPKKCQPDYRYYLDHQVKVPCIQIFALALEKLPGYRKGWMDETPINKLRDKGKSQKDIDDKISSMKEKETEKLLLGEILRKDDNQVSGNSMITDFFGVSSRNQGDKNIFPQWKDIKKKMNINTKYNEEESEEKIEKIKKKVKKERERKIIEVEKEFDERIIDIPYKVQQKMGRIKKTRKDEEGKNKKDPIDVKVRKTRRKVEEVLNCNQ